MIPCLNFLLDSGDMEIGLRLIGALGKFLGYLLWPVYFILSFRKVPTLSPIKSNLLTISASILAEKIRTKQVYISTI